MRAPRLEGSESMKSDELNLLVAEGEGLTVEFKEKYTPKIDRDIVALANGRGGFIILGVDDGGKVRGEKLTNRMKAEILSLARNCEPPITIPKVSQIGKMVVIEVPEGDERPYGCSSGYFRRLDAVTQKMIHKEVRSMFRATADKLFEDLPRKDCGLADISINKIKAFLTESGTAFKITRNNIAPFLASLGVYKGGKINNAAALMFARNIGKFIPHAELICCAFKGANKNFIYDRKDIRSDLLTQLNEAMAFIQRQLNIRSEIHGLDRHDIYELPPDALREAVVNAIVHRDYSFQGTSINVDVYDDRVEIVNPGGLPEGLDRRDFGKISVRRNLIIADIFHRMGKVERIGSGISRMQNIMKATKLEPPKFEMTNFFRAIFYRNPEYSLKHIPAKVGKNAEKSKEKSKEKIIGLIAGNPRITTREIANSLNLSIAGVEKAMRILRQQGQLKRVGPDKGGHWEIIE